MKRRKFIKQLVWTTGGAALGVWGGERPLSALESTQGGGASRVVLVRTDDRGEGARRAMKLFGLPKMQGESVFLKPNYNSADPAPGSTHEDILKEMVSLIKDAGASITVGDRSGMGETRQVMEQKGVFALAKKMGFKTVVFDDLDASQWKHFKPANDHWLRGFALPLPTLQADHIVQACCLKTHRYGGVFTMSLKNSVGLVAKRIPGGSHDYMRELHGSKDQRQMIAEINLAYKPSLIVMDGVQAFVEGGPAKGKRVDSRVVLAAQDRVALDAVGVAILRHFGTTPAVEEGPIFGLDQIARAAELGLGASSSKEIELITDDDESAAFAQKIRAILDQG